MQSGTRATNKGTVGNESWRARSWGRANTLAGSHDEVNAKVVHGGGNTDIVGVDWENVGGSCRFKRDAKTSADFGSWWRFGCSWDGRIRRWLGVWLGSNSTAGGALFNAGNQVTLTSSVSTGRTSEVAAGSNETRRPVPTSVAGGDSDAAGTGGSDGGSVSGSGATARRAVPCSMRVTR
jgi:hypothetical protein